MSNSSHKIEKKLLQHDPSFNCSIVKFLTYEILDFTLNNLEKRGLDGIADSLILCVLRDTEMYDGALSKALAERREALIRELNEGIVTRCGHALKKTDIKESELFKNDSLNYAFNE